MWCLKSEGKMNFTMHWIRIILRKPTYGGILSMTVGNTSSTPVPALAEIFKISSSLMSKSVSSCLETPSGSASLRSICIHTLQDYIFDTIASKCLTLLFRKLYPKTSILVKTFHTIKVNSFIQVKCKIEGFLIISFWFSTVQWFNWTVENHTKNKNNDIYSVRLRKKWKPTKKVR